MSILHAICVYALILLINHVSSQQSYDHTDCRAQPQMPGSNYLCNSNSYPCQTFIVYRTQNDNTSISSISSLFNLNSTVLLTLNNLNQSESDQLPLDRDIIIPVTCSCAGRFSQAVFNYNVSASVSLATVACNVYEGLLKAQTLVEQNPNYQGNVSAAVEIIVPIRCACPDKNNRGNGTNYLVTYPIVTSDNTSYIAEKFGVTGEMVLASNNLPPFLAIYPQTTLLIPTKDIPVINLEITRPEESSPGPVTSVPLKKFPPSTSSTQKRSYIVIGLAIAVSIFLILLVIGFLLHLRKVLYPHSFQPLSARSSQLSNFSADFLDGMAKLKHSVHIFSLQELQLATGDFCDASLVGCSVYHGIIMDLHLAIEQMESEDVANQVLDILTKINHLNIVRLEGFCYGTRPYLVFEFAANGCLRDLLSNEKLAGQLSWSRRMQIAFDIAVAIHYMHHCTNPSYVHRDINSKNVLITVDWRAKISNFKCAKPIIYDEEKSENESGSSNSVLVGQKGYLSPEYIHHGSSSPKVDIFAFGVVLLELMSNKEAVTEVCMLKDSVEFLADGGIEGSSDCLEKLKEFMDPSLQGDYPLGDALCLMLLAKACVEKDPNHRPTMNDVLKALSRIV